MLERDGRLAAHPGGAESSRRCRSPDPRAWTTVPAFARLLEELSDSRTGLSRLKRQILEVLADGPRTPHDLLESAVASEHPPWVGDATVFALARDLEPLVAFHDGRYELTPDGAAILAGTVTRPPIDRRLGGVPLRPRPPRLGLGRHHTAPGPARLMK